MPGFLLLNILWFVVGPRPMEGNLTTKVWGFSLIFVFVVLIFLFIGLQKRKDRKRRELIGRAFGIGSNGNQVTWQRLEDFARRQRGSTTLMAPPVASEWFYQVPHVTVATFTQEVLHEIKQPLTVIQGYVQLLRQNFQDDQQVDQDLAVVEEQIKRLMGFVKRMGHFKPVFAETSEEVRVEGILENFQRLVEPVLNRRGIELVIDTGPLPVVHLPTGQFQQVLWNLVTNAMEALKDETIENPRIRIRVRHFNPVIVATRMTDGVGCGITVQIEDNGPGIPESMRSRIFDAFYTTKGDVHIGLGMTICRDIVRMNGGKMEVQTSSGGGTEFRVWWPCHAKHA